MLCCRDESACLPASPGLNYLIDVLRCVSPMGPLVQLPFELMYKTHINVDVKDIYLCITTMSTEVHMLSS